MVWTNVAMSVNKKMSTLAQKQISRDKYFTTLQNYKLNLLTMSQMSTRAVNRNVKTLSCVNIDILNKFYRANAAFAISLCYVMFSFL